MMKGELVDEVLAVEPKSDRVNVVVMSFEIVKVRVISAYASQQNRNEKEKVKFCEDVSDVLSQAGSDDLWYCW